MESYFLSGGKRQERPEGNFLHAPSQTPKLALRAARRRFRLIHLPLESIPQSAVQSLISTSSKTPFLPKVSSHKQSTQNPRTITGPSDAIANHGGPRQQEEKGICLFLDQRRTQAQTFGFIWLSYRLCRGMGLPRQVGYSHWLDGGFKF